MEKRRNVCVFLVLAALISISYSVDARSEGTHGTGDGAKLSVKPENSSTTSAPVPSTNATTKPPLTTTPLPVPSPNTTTSTPSTSTNPPNTTTVIPPTPPSTSTPIPPTIPPNTSTITPPTPSTPTPAPPQPKPDRSFDLPSFVGGIILALGILAIGYVVYKFYRARTDPNYRTL